MTCKVWALVVCLGIGGLLGCSDSTPGIEVDLGVVHKNSETITNNLGAQITLRSAYVVLMEAEIAPCETAFRMPAWFDFLLPVQSAWAHTESNGFKLGEPIAEDFFAADLTRNEWGAIGPPSGSYCHLNITVGPADEDAKNLPDSVNLVGKSYYVEGTVVPDPMAPLVSQDFEIFSTAPGTTEIEAETPIDLSMEKRTASITLTMVPDHWFDDVDFESMTQGEIRDKVLANIVASVQLQE